jgi:hypothetical protein
MSISETTLEEESRSAEPVTVPLFSPSSSEHNATPSDTAMRVTFLQVVRTEPDDPCAETRFRLSEKRTSTFESAGVSAQSAGRRLC